MINQTNSSEDKYVHGMDWSKNIQNFELTNYKQYQHNLISKFLGQNILEIGSGNRIFTNLIAEQHVFNKLVSLEPSQTLYDLHDGKFNFPENVSFHIQDLFDVTTNDYGRFDTITMIHVLEHIKEDKAALDHLHSLLADKGKLLIEVPALPFLFSPHDEMVGHYRRYNKNNLRTAIDLEKFKIVDMWYQDPIGVFGSLLFFKLRKIKLKSEKGNKLFSKQGRFYDQKLIPIQEKIERYVRFPFGLSLTAILEKH